MASWIVFVPRTDTHPCDFVPHTDARYAVRPRHSAGAPSPSCPIRTSGRPALTTPWVRIPRSAFVTTAAGPPPPRNRTRAGRNSSLGTKPVPLPRRRGLPTRANGIQPISHHAEGAAGCRATDLARGQAGGDDIGMRKGLGQGGEGVHAPTLGQWTARRQPPSATCGQRAGSGSDCGRRPNVSSTGTKTDSGCPCGARSPRTSVYAVRSPRPAHPRLRSPTRRHRARTPEGMRARWSVRCDYSALGGVILMRAAWLPANAFATLTVVPNATPASTGLPVPVTVNPKFSP